MKVEPESEPGFCFLKNRTGNQIPGSILLQTITGNTHNLFFKTGTRSFLFSYSVLCRRSLFADRLRVSFCARKCNEIAVHFLSLSCNSSSSAFRAPLMCVHSLYIYTSSIYITEHGRADQNSASRSNFVFLLEILD